MRYIKIYFFFYYGTNKVTGIDITGEINSVKFYEFGDHGFGVRPVIEINASVITNA